MFRLKGIPKKIEVITGKKKIKEARRQEERSNDNVLYGVVIPMIIAFFFFIMGLIAMNG